jgi:hypothetical protein
MEDFKEEDVLRFIVENELDTKSRKRELLDPRNFCINILYYKFNWTEIKLAKFFEKLPSTMNNSKRLAYELQKDKKFLINTQKVRDVFPQWVPKITLTPGNKMIKPITVCFSSRQHSKIIEYIKKKKKPMSIVIKEIVLNHIENE